jgi:membrane protease YdiL (CAAX protease family)
MEPDNPTAAPVPPTNQITPVEEARLAGSSLSDDGGGAGPGDRGLHWVFIGPNGLRAGWSVAIFMVLMIGALALFGYLLDTAHLAPRVEHLRVLTVRMGFLQEVQLVLAIVIAAWLVSKIERRSLLDYNLRGPRPVARFFSGAVTGIVALSLLIAGLVAGGWMHFDGVGLSGGRILIFGAAWGVVFLLVGFAEEGLVRCYLLFTLGRGLNFWWSLGMVACLCARVALNTRANGTWGTYVIALLGLAPCLVLYLKKAQNEGFWDAAWVTSVFFGAGHTGNDGESWVGIFSAAGIGVVFCASVKLTGSAWWAIGAHAAWDWGQSYLYGTPDSGLMAHGHLLNSSYSLEHVIWSGGTTGPEGSILILPIMVFILLVVLVQYGRKRKPAEAALAGQTAG